jgi:hypothetical protein
VATMSTLIFVPTIFSMVRKQSKMAGQSVDS